MEFRLEGFVWVCQSLEGKGRKEIWSGSYRKGEGANIRTSRV